MSSECQREGLLKHPGVVFCGQLRRGRRGEHETTVPDP